MEERKVSIWRGGRYWLRLTLFAVFLLLGMLYVGNTYLNVIFNERPFRTLPIDSPDSGYEVVGFPATDGVSLYGWYLPPTGIANGATIILAHGLGGDHSRMMAHARVLIESGYGVLLFDHRAHGGSDGDLSGLGWAEDRDVLGAVAYLQKRPDVDPKRIGAAGLSLGATAVIRAAAQSDAIRAVWSDGPGGVVPHDFVPPCTLRQVLNTPSWFIYYWVHESESELPRPDPMTEAIRALADRPLTVVIAGQSTIEMCHIRHWLREVDREADGWLIGDVAHIGGMGAHPEEYAGRMIDFFDRALLD